MTTINNAVYQRRLLMHKVGIALSSMAMAIGVFFLMWILCSFLLGLALGIGMVKLLRWMQKSPWGDLTKIGVYWFLPTKNSFKTFPPSYIREFMG